ncbi:MAG TPA: hypothetical protein VHO01_10885 [Jatrophihabitans sp.]|nr:hypothetical protein [Jatrophihabitans sp.]
MQYFPYALAGRGIFSVLAAWSLYGARGEVRTQLANANKTKGWDNAELNHQVDLVLRASLLNAGFLVILLALIAKFVWDGKMWARWIYLAVIVLLARDEYALTAFFGYHHLLPRVLTGLTGVFGLASLVLLFLPASNAFFRPVGAAARPGGLFGALVQSRVNPGVPMPTGKTPPEQVSLRKPEQRADRAATARPASRGPRGKSRQAPKRPGQR